MRFVAVFMLVLLLLAGCGGEDDAVQPPLHGVTISGSTIEMNGTYKSNCHYSIGGATYLYLYLNISGSKVVQSADAFDANDSTCSGSVVGSSSAELEFHEAGTTVTSSGWVDSAGNTVSAPLASDGMGLLGANVSGSVFNITAKTTGLVYVAGQSFQKFVIIDDSGNQPVLHFAFDYPSSLNVETDPVYTRQ